MTTMPTETPTEAPDKLDPEELLESLNGYEEAALELHFGLRLDDVDEKAIGALRALVFILEVRKARKNDEARPILPSEVKEPKHAAMAMTLRQLMDLFDIEEAPTAASTAEDGPGNE